MPSAKHKKEPNKSTGQTRLVRLAPLTPARVALALVCVAALVVSCQWLLVLPHRQQTVLLAMGTAAVCVMTLLRPIPQDPNYHNFADQRGLLCCGCGGSGGRTGLRVPNFGDVASNVPFVVIGAMGLYQLHSGAIPKSSDAVVEWEVEVGWPTFFWGIFATGFGSAVS